MSRPRNALRRLLITCAAVALLFIAALAVLRLPAVQTWLAKRLVASQPGWALHDGHLDIGPGGLDAHSIDFAMPGLAAKSAPISVRVRPSRLLSRELVVEQVSIDQLDLEITPARFSPDSSAPGGFAGVLQLLQAPLAWSIGQTRVNARIGIREGDTTVATGELRVTGGGLSPGSTGAFAYTFNAASALLPPAPDNFIRSEGTVRITQNATHGIARVELDGDLRLPDYGGFTLPPARLHLLLENTPAGECYRATVSFGDEARLTILSGFNPRENDTGFDLHFTAQPAWLARLDPRLASLGAWQAHLVAALDLNAAAPAPRDTRLVVKSDTTPFRLTLAQDGAARTARVQLAGLPLAWANAWLPAPATRLTGGAIDGTGLVALGPDGVLTVTTDDLTAASDTGDRINAAFTATHMPAKGLTRAAGSLSGALPTLLAGPDQPLPFIATARWDATLAGDGTVQLDALEFTARKTPDATPVVSLALQQPLRIGPTLSVASLASAPAPDLLRFAVNGLPLSWLSRWTPGTALEGTWAEGESVLRRSEDGAGLIFSTRIPWTFTGLSARKAGATRFAGNARIAPEFSYAAEQWSARLATLAIEDADDNRLSGDAYYEWKPAGKTFRAALNLNASLPALPHSRYTFGALDVVLKASAGTASGAVSQIDQLALTVGAATGPLLSVHSPEPVFVVRKPDGEIIFNTLAPLRVQTAAFPLAWARPWLPPGTAVTGTLAAADLLLHAEPQKFHLRPLKPLVVEALSVTRGGVTTVRDARLSFFPGADVQVIHQLKPAFQLVFKGSAHATDGSLDIGGRRAADFEAALGFIGNDTRALPQSIEAQARLDLAALDPRRAGRMVARLNGDLLGAEPVDFWARLDDVNTLPPLEISARGKVDGRRRAADFDVSIQYLTTPVASDAAFRATLNLLEETLTFDSALVSRFMDVTAALALVEALQPPPAREEPAREETRPADAALARTDAGDDARRSPSTLGTGPFWSVLRGQFDLELGAVQFAPYRIDDVRGRLELTKDRLSIVGLTGTMFAGVWSGGLRIDHEPRPGADHFLTAGFRIAQFETARVVQTAFPNEFGSFDARITLDAAVRGDGDGLRALLDNAEGEFSIEGRDGVVRLTHPAADTASTLLVLGGAVAFSPELRALGRLLRKFAEMPVGELRVSGERDAGGNIVLTEFMLDSPQARLIGRGAVPAQDGVPLAARRLDLALELFARDEIGVIMANMRLLDTRATAGGYRKMTQPFSVRGEVGRPDASPLYDLLARAATGSRGTWGLIMRKVRQEAEKQRAAQAAP